MIFWTWWKNIWILLKNLFKIPEQLPFREYEKLDLPTTHIDRLNHKNDMTDETKKLYEFLDQLKNWHENLKSEVEETKALARAAEKKKHRKRFWRMVLEKDSEAYAINQVFHEFEEKFDLGFKEVETSKVESDTLPGVFYDVIKMENASTEEILTTVAKCPSGALSIKKTD